MNVQGNLNIHLTIPSPSSLQLQQGWETPQTAAVYSESENYSNQLLRQGRGFPLYAPKPCKSHPAEYRRRGVTIGDVGTVTPDGNFDFFFNIYRSADDPVNTNVPEGFVPLSLYDRGDVTREDFDPGDYVARLAPSSIRGINDAFSEPELGRGFVFSCRGADGAVLALPHGSHLEKLRNVAEMRRYATKHAESWYKHVNDIRGRGLVNGSLYLVTGCEKAESWGIATFHDVASQNENEFQLSFAPTGMERLSIRLPLFTDSIFLSAKRSVGGFLTNASEGSGVAPALDTISDASPIPRVFHPSQIIHERILREAPQAAVVITHDDDWRDIFRESTLSRSTGPHSNYKPHRIPTIITHLHFPLAPPPIPHSQPALLALLAPEKLYKDSTLAAVSPDTSALIPTSTSGDGNDTPDGSFEFEEKPRKQAAVAADTYPLDSGRQATTFCEGEWGWGWEPPRQRNPEARLRVPRMSTPQGQVCASDGLVRGAVRCQSRGLVCEYAVSSENATGTGVLGDNRDGDVHMPSADMAATERTRDGDRTKRTRAEGVGAGWWRM
ncbi:hypothetical protein B0H14DRAFT_3745764 [Mycena olivaceomarginata]|nr:hypothetical protein B0H14DRAFT_3745764 [Mycena olivaceomarginata]